MTRKLGGMESNTKELAYLEGIAADGEHGEAGEIIREGSIKPVSIRSGYWLHNPDVKIAERGVLRKAEEIAERAAEAERTEARHRHREKNSMGAPVRPHARWSPFPIRRLRERARCPLGFRLCSLARLTYERTWFGLD